MHTAGELHSVKDVLPPPGSDVLAYWEQNGDAMRAKYIDTGSGPIFRTRFVGGELTPTHWAFFNPKGL